jgi:hypothetical protein
LDLAWAHGSKAMATPWVMNKLHWCTSLRVMELTELGAHAMLGVLVLGHLAEKNEVRPLQGLGDPGGIDDAIEWCA